MIYLAVYSKGDWDDYSETIVFASESEKTVSDWVEKFNKILKKWKAYYSQFEEEKMCEECRAWIKDEYIEQYFERWIELRDINHAFIKQIESR